MAITSNNFAKALYPGVNKWYGQSYDEYAVEYTKLFDTFSSRRAYEEDVSVSGFGLAAVKPEGGAIAYDTAQQGFLTRYTPIVYALGFIITEEMVEDDLYDVIGKQKASALAKSMRQTKETVAANIYNRADNSSYTGGDGVELMSSLHPNRAGGTYANELATATDLSEAAVEQACIDISRLEDDRGLLAAIMPKSLHIPVDLSFDADRLFHSTSRPGTADNDLNTMIGKFPGGIHVNHYFTDANAWFIRTSCDNGMKHFERKSDTFAIDSDFETGNAKFKAQGRYAFGWSDPRSFFGSNPA